MTRKKTKPKSHTKNPVAEKARRKHNRHRNDNGGAGLGETGQRIVEERGS